MEPRGGDPHRVGRGRRTYSPRGCGGGLAPGADAALRRNNSPPGLPGIHVYLLPSDRARLSSCPWPPPGAYPGAATAGCDSPGRCQGGSPAQHPSWRSCGRSLVVMPPPAPFPRPSRCWATFSPTETTHCLRPPAAPLLCREESASTAPPSSPRRTRSAPGAGPHQCSVSRDRTLTC